VVIAEFRSVKGRIPEMPGITGHGDKGAEKTSRVLAGQAASLRGEH